MNSVDQNQLHPPQKKNRGKVDLNVRRRIFYKDGDSTMLFCSNITIPASKVLISSIKDTMSKLGVELKGHFIVIQ